MMKKLFFFGMMSALALTFVACSSEEEVAPVNPTFDGTSVKAEFSINLPTKFATRMQKAITQDDGTLAVYRPIKKANLFLAPYATTAQGDNNPVKVTDAKVGTVAIPSDLTLTDHTNALDKWYNDVQVPVGTNAFVVYAQPDKSGSDAQNGALTMTLPDGVTDPFADLSKLNFNLKPIAANFNIATATDGKTITDALTAIADAEGYAYNGATAKVKFSAVAEADNQYYFELFKVFKGLKAGSKTDVYKFLDEQLKPALIMNTGLTTGGLDKAVADAVDAAITAVDGVSAFPGNGLPDGAAVLAFADGKFSYTTDMFIDGEAPLKCGPNAYVYPASLWYRANTGIRTANEIKSTSVGSQTWAAFIAAWTADKMVKASSQSVALVNPLQYAVGNFETQIKFAKENYQVKTIKTTDESTGAVTSEDVVEVKYNQLKLNGILIGDQRNVDWQFMPFDGTTAKPNPAVVIYDTDLFTSFAPSISDFVPACQTLVCETAEKTNDAVNVALEFINNSTKPIMGVDGIVPVGCKFYLIGQLKNKELNDNYSKLTEGNAKKIFEQDYKTIARFLINDLKNTAYNTIPDLRSPELEFGLSVDLTWQKGYEFLINIGSAD